MRIALLIFTSCILCLVTNKISSQELSEITFLVETGLKDQPSIKISKQQISISKGLLQQIEGDFNPILNFSYNRSQDVFPETKIYREGFFGDSTQSYNSNFFSYNLEVTKRFQNGLFLSPGVNLRNNGKDFSYNLLESLGEGQFITNRSNVYLRPLNHY